jgi:hypothetical protein
LGVCFASHCGASTNFYVDPDWTGPQSGTASQPWATLASSAWTAINSALANGDVTIYFSALKANGVTQQSAARFIQCRRTDYSAHRLTMDGYSFYNSSETSPNWLANPEPDIAVAYLSGKVFKTTGNGTMALGWARQDGNDFVSHNGLTLHQPITSRALALIGLFTGISMEVADRLGRAARATSAIQSRTMLRCAASR